MTNSGRPPAPAGLGGPEIAAGAAGALPNVIILGAQKCGTSALYSYLDTHPEIGMSRPKELDFFLKDRNWRHGVEWYAQQFDATLPVRGEASPNYTAQPSWPGVAERMAAVLPDTRLIYLVRDPLERIASQWVHNWAVGREERTLAEAIGLRSRTYVARSRYMMQLDHYLEHYPAEQLLILDQADLRHRRVETLQRVFGFLGVDPGFRHPKFDSEIHVTRAKGRPSAPVKWLDQRIAHSRARTWIGPGAFTRLEARLRGTEIPRPDVRAALSAESLDLLREDAERLRAFTGMPLAHWSV